MFLQKLKSPFLGYNTNDVIISENNFFGIIYGENDINLGYFISTSKPQTELTDIEINIEDISNILRLVVNGAEISVKTFEKTFLNK